MKLLLALLVVCGLALQDEHSDTIAEFRKFYGKDRSPRERVDAVKALQSIDTLEAAQAVCVAFEDEDPTVRAAAIEVVSGYRREETARWLADDVLGPKTAKRSLLRAGAAESLGGMKHSFAYAPLAELLQTKDFEVQLAAIRALGKLKDAQACPALVQVVSGPDSPASIEAIGALVAIGSAEGAEPGVQAGLKHADWRVRARAIQAVGQLRLKSGIRPLIDMYENEEGRLVGDAYQLLKDLTQRDLGEFPEDWRKWWDGAEPGFVIPEPGSKPKTARSDRGTYVGDSYKRTTATAKEFIGIATRSEHLLFVIDVSGSMEVPFGDPERLKSTGRTYTSYQRLQIVKEELMFTIQELPETTNFNVIAFATNVKPWKKDAVKASVLNKSAACAWVSSLKPLGGEKAAFKAQAGLALAPSQEGATNTHLALMTALGAPPDGKTYTGTGGKAAAKDPLDTIFFLTDGEPTVGKCLDMNEIRDEVKRVNAARGVQIHVIYVGEFGGEEFEKLAHENGGVFIAIGG